MSRKEPATALILSFIIPGVGQLYTGRIGWAIFWFIVTPGLWIGSGGMLGWVAHIVSALQAQGQADRV
jgi:TM2 domain-containing membrane protein YozV